MLTKYLYYKFWDISSKHIFYLCLLYKFVINFQIRKNIFLYTDHKTYLIIYNSNIIEEFTVFQTVAKNIMSRYGCYYWNTKCRCTFLYLFLYLTVTVNISESFWNQTYICIVYINMQGFLIEYFRLFDILITKVLNISSSHTILEI